jgi:hypothetical protein
MRLDVPEEPIKVHFQRPKEPYQDPQDPSAAYWWKKGAKHYIPKFNKFTECAYEQCLTCAYRNPGDFDFEDAQPQKFLEKCWPKEYYSVCGWVEEWHIVLERESDRKNDDGSPKTFFERVLEIQAKKELKDAGYDPKKLDLLRVFGRRFYLDITAPAWKNEFDAVYQQIERFTKDEGYLFPLSYGCAECGTPVFSVASECPSCDATFEQGKVGIDHEKHKAYCGDCDTEWELLECRSKSLKKDAEAICECEECGHQGYLIPLLAKVDLESGEVDLEPPAKGWDTYDIFDVQLVIRKERSTDEAPPRIVIDDWEIQPRDKRLVQAEFQGGKNDDDAKKIAERHAEPLDLDMIHAPDSPAVQAKVLKLANLFSKKNGVTSGGAMRYSKRAEESDDGDSDDDDDE